MRRIPLPLIPFSLRLKKITASDGAASDHFGTLCLPKRGYGGGRSRLYDDDNGTWSGSAYIFDRDEGGPDNWGEVTKITASDGAASDHFGHSVSLSGDTVVVGTAWGR